MERVSDLKDDEFSRSRHSLTWYPLGICDVRFIRGTGFKSSLSLQEKAKLTRTESSVKEVVKLTPICVLNCMIKV